MNLLEAVGVASTLTGVAYGFGTQGNKLAVLRRNVDDIAKMHRETINELHDANVTLAEIRKDIEYLKEKTK